MADTSKSRFLVNAWYKKASWLYLLWPVSIVYRIVVCLRQQGYQLGVFKSFKAPVPVIVVGNLSVGGTGKTPLVIALVKALQADGLKPAIVSRGYTSKAPVYPYFVNSDSKAEEAGDEPLLLAIRTKVPVVIDPDRASAVRSLLEHHNCDVIVCDDGLQHYALKRDIELVVVDGQRMFGNSLCLPAGPLREPVSRLQKSDYVVANGDFGSVLDTSIVTCTMKFLPTGFERVQKNDASELVAVSDWNDSKHVHAVAGIGNPARFFDSLRDMGFVVIEHAFDDHHYYCKSDIEFTDDLPVIMTEKDAVKVRRLALNINLKKYWFVPISAVMDEGILSNITKRTKALLVN